MLRPAVLCVPSPHPPPTPHTHTHSVLRSSLDSLRIASQLRAAGDVHPATQLWVVANPNNELTADLLERKVR